MFKITLINFFLVFEHSSTNKLPFPHDDHPPDFPQTIHQVQINDLRVGHNECRERLNVCCFIGLMIVVQLRMMLPIIWHVLIYMSELKQQQLQDTNVLSHIPKIQQFADMTLKRTITMTAKVIIKIQSLDTTLLAATTVKIMFAIYWILQKNS